MGPQIRIAYRAKYKMLPVSAPPVSNYHTFVEQQIKFILLLFVLSFSFGRMAQLVAHLLHKLEVPGSNPRHRT